MKLFSYYLQIVLPFPILYLFLEVLHSSWSFFIGLLLYAIVYRGFTDGYRLQKLGLIGKNELWKMFIPFSTFRLKYFRELYFENN
jgi:hypothetical protein